jgi:hypothetical protein
LSYGVIEQLFTFRSECRHFTEKSGFATAGVSLNQRQFPDGEIGLSKPFRRFIRNISETGYYQTVFIHAPFFTTESVYGSIVCPTLRAIGERSQASLPLYGYGAFMYESTPIYTTLNDSTKNTVDYFQ